MVELALESRALSPRDARVGNEYIKASIQIADGSFDSGGDVFEGSDVYLVRFTYLSPY